MLGYSTYRVYMDFVIQGPETNALVIGAYDRSLATLKAFAASLNLAASNLKSDSPRKGWKAMGMNWECYFTPIVTGKEKFYHMVAISKKVGKDFIISRKEKVYEDFYNFLMKNFDLPLMREWAKPLYEACLDQNYIQICDFETVVVDEDSSTAGIPVRNEFVPFEDLVTMQSMMTEERLKEVVTELLGCHAIQICEEEQNQLQFKDMDEYFREYGHTMVENLREQIQPLTELDGNVHDFTLKHMRLYPQQIAQINGMLAQLDHCNYGIINHGMGTGKTIGGASICEGYFARKWLKAHPKAELKDVYMEPDTIQYRNIIMCPGHLVSKWASEIRNEVPYAKVTVIVEFEQLLELWKKGAKRDGREYFVVSKDFSKLSYQNEPSVRHTKHGYIERKICKDCGKIIVTAANYCDACRTDHITTEKTEFFDWGMTCPDCGRILIPGNKNAKYEEWRTEDNATSALTPYDFANHTEANDKCFYCGTNLWQPHVANIGNYKKNVWVRATHWANKAKKGKKTVWVHEKYMDYYFSTIGERPLGVKETTGVRKYSPSLFIKKHMRNFFDFAVFDEAHLYKGGKTAQGIAMHSLCKASKKQLALTGTIAGGYADHLFYLLWRLDPARMVKEGFSFYDVLQFSEIYGSVCREYALGDSDEDNVFNTSSHGKQLGTPKVKPGISPLIFMKFLLDRTTFLDLSDMSKYLPALNEKVVTVAPSLDEESDEHKAYADYRGVCSVLKQAIRQPEIGKGIMSTMLQFSLSYLDKPNGVSPILNPKDGTVIATPGDNAVFGKADVLLSKEKELIKIVDAEIKEGRNCFIYAEYSSSPETCVTYRLKEIVENHCHLKGKVAVLESSSPKASEREKWMHMMAKQGIKVFITNPKCVETGLDFCFKEDGKTYNYPTIIFYQMGYSMFTISQASRRHYRLNQKKECRTYYMAWKGTVQEAVIGLIAEKQVATSAIQGKFSTEGLAAMASGVDVRLKLASAMADMDTENGNDLQEMFDVINETGVDSGEYDTFEPMKLLVELVGDEVIIQRSVEEMQGKQAFDPFYMFAQFSTEEEVPAADVVADVEAKEVDDQKTQKEPVFDFMAMFRCVEVAPVNTGKKRKKKTCAGQMSLFGC